MRSLPPQTDGYAMMSSHTYHAVVSAHKHQRHRKLLILTDVTTAGTHQLPTHGKARVAPGTWGHRTSIGDCITFDAETSASTGQLIRIVRVYDSHGNRLDHDKPGKRQELIRQYQTGISMADLGRERGASRQYISTVLRDIWRETHGAVPPRLRPTEHEAALQRQVAGLHLAGLNRKQIAAHLKVNTQRVSAIITAAGLPEQICANCPNPCPKGSKYCDDCRQQVQQEQPRTRASNMRARNARLKAAGLCHICQQPTGDGQTRCPECRGKKAAQARDRLRYAGANRNTP